MRVLLMEKKKSKSAFKLFFKLNPFAAITRFQMRYYRIDLNVTPGFYFSLQVFKWGSIQKNTII